MMGKITPGTFCHSQQASSDVNVYIFYCLQMQSTLHPECFLYLQCSCMYSMASNTFIKHSTCNAVSMVDTNNDNLCQPKQVCAWRQGIKRLGACVCCTALL